MKPKTIRPWKLPLAALAGVISTPASGQELAHRWSFDTLEDSVGTADAALVGTAALSGSGSLNLPGGGTRANYATVPLGSTLAGLSSMTVEVWFTMNAQQDWSKAWMFGTANGSANASPYIDFTPRAGIAGNPPSAGFKVAGTDAESNTRADPNSAALATGTPIHGTVVFDSEKDTISLYINGALADSADWNGKISDLGNTVDNFIGAPVQYNDPDFNGTINELRIWDGALTPALVSANDAAGPDAIPVNDPKMVVSNVTASSPGGPAAVDIPISNSGGSQTLSISNVAISGLDTDFFTLPATFPQDIAPGGSAPLSLDFDPEGLTGVFEVDVEITSDDNLDPTKTIHLKVSVSEPDAAYTTELGTAANTDGPRSYAIQITNNGTADLEIYDAFLTETAAAPHYYQRFTVDHDFLEEFIVIPPGESGSIPMTFDPSGLGAGEKTALVTLDTNEFDNLSPALVVSVDVTGTIDDGATALAHRWSFDDTSDSVGAADLELFGNASLASGALNLPGGGTRLDYANLPIGETLATSNSVSVESWFTIGAAEETWRKVWMFGSGQATESGSVWMDFTPYPGDPAGVPSVTMKSPADRVSTRDGDNPPALSVGAEHHQVAVFDSAAGMIFLYLDGALADSIAWAGTVHDIGITDDNYLGAPVFFGDLDWNGSINEMRIWKGSLSSTDVAASYAGGPASVIEPGATPPEPLRIGSVMIVDGNLTLSATGLQAGMQYHLETGVTLDDFAPLAGSTFTAGDSVPPIPVAGPKRFARIVEGPEP
ncbi:LamG-like jellyroll fold domain-containing protein [Haloferula sargassicola]|uniref:LamG-like jellyroll fold domain-containing protein n=1 Tax=Haloferula sargassicola TaxID=490096 RepID=A0ABP9UH95_9BACT